MTTERKPRKLPPKPTWREEYNCHSFLPTYIPVVVQWPVSGGEGFEVRVGKFLAEDRYKDLVQGKLKGLVMAKELAELTIENAEKEIDRLLMENPDIAIPKATKWRAPR